MDIEKVKKSFMPMTETAFYILLSLNEPRHGYGIILNVRELTKDRINLGSGTVYGTLKKFQKSGITTVYFDLDGKTIYEITDIGKELMRLEMERIEELQNNALRFKGDF